VGASPNPIDSAPTNAYDHFLTQTTGQVFRKAAGKGAVHLVREGRALCGETTWLIAGPAALFADLLPDKLCKRCLRVQVSRSIPNRQLGLDLDYGDD
jgi:hypothetical protein